VHQHQFAVRRRSYIHLEVIGARFVGRLKRAHRVLRVMQMLPAMRDRYHVFSCLAWQVCRAHQQYKNSFRHFIEEKFLEEKPEHQLDRSRRFRTGD
jgi:hypothetical protein